jgi:hypothetical protein
MTSKKLSIVLVLLLLLAVPVMVVGAQEAVSRVWPSSDATSVSSGQEFTVTIHVGEAEQIYGSSFKLDYDAAAFEVVQANGKVVTPGAFFEGQPGFELKNSAQGGVVEYALTLMQPAQPVSGTGVIGTITFRALQDGPVAMAVSEASLVSPEFSEVNGRLVAQRITQVAAEVDNSQLAPLTQPVQAAVASASVSAAPASPVVASTSASNPESIFGSPATNQPAGSFLNSDNMPMVVAGLFFALGLVLLTVSVGIYARMRANLTLIAEESFSI